jgi:6-phosphogluconolactonase
LTPPYKIFPSPEDLSVHLVEELIHLSHSAAKHQKKINIALSGGSTPKILFQLLAQPSYRNEINWKILHFYWGDERCVPPDHPESNYGMTRESLLQFIENPKSNIHRIKGEILADKAANSYSREILQNVPAGEDGIPRFDLILLGMGEDGHTASLFPGSEVLKIKDKICAVAAHPVSGQKRVTLTLPVINHAKKVSFLVTGKSKSRVISEIFNRAPGFDHYPAAHIDLVQGKLIWLLDKAASNFI